jgi:hypothetical protein
VTVTITADGYSTFGDVAETLPAGFTYSSSSLPAVQVTSVGQTVTLSLLGATSPTTFTYTVKASSVEGDHSFTGVFSGVNAAFEAFSGVRVGRDSSITVAATTTPPASGPTASRSFSADPVDAGGQVTVTITADGYSTFGDVAETLPAGFEVTVTITADGYSTFGDVAETLPAGFDYVSSDLPDDQVTDEGQTVKFALIGGTPPTTFKYTVTASSVGGDYSFTGVFSGVKGDFEAFDDV